MKINAKSYVPFVINGHVSVWEVLMILRRSESAQMRAEKFNYKNYISGHTNSVTLLIPNRSKFFMMRPLLCSKSKIGKTFYDMSSTLSVTQSKLLIGNSQEGS